jgi:acetylglutamate kinase
MDRGGNVFPALDREQTDALKREGVITGGFIPKVDACLSALEHVPEAVILDGGRPHAIVEHLIERKTAGTVFRSAVAARA